MKKGLIYLILGSLAWITITPEDTSELKKDLIKMLEIIRPKANIFYEAIVELLDDLEGVHSDEVKANISKRMDTLQKEVGLFNSSSDGGINSISKKVKKTIDDIKNDISKGVKK